MIKKENLFQYLFIETMKDKWLKNLNETNIKNQQFSSGPSLMGEGENLLLVLRKKKYKNLNLVRKNSKIISSKNSKSYFLLFEKKNSALISTNTLGLRSSSNFFLKNSNNTFTKEKIKNKKLIISNQNDFKNDIKKNYPKQSLVLDFLLKKKLTLVKSKKNYDNKIFFSNLFLTYKKPFISYWILSLLGILTFSNTLSNFDFIPTFLYFKDKYSSFRFKESASFYKGSFSPIVEDSLKEGRTNLLVTEQVRLTNEISQNKTNLTSFLLNEEEIQTLPEGLKKLKFNWPNIDIDSNLTKPLNCNFLLLNLFSTYKTKDFLNFEKKQINFKKNLFSPKQKELKILFHKIFSVNLIKNPYSKTFFKLKYKNLNSIIINNKNEIFLKWYWFDFYLNTPRLNSQKYLFPKKYLILLKNSFENPLDSFKNQITNFFKINFMFSKFENFKSKNILNSIPLRFREESSIVALQEQSKQRSALDERGNQKKSVFESMKTSKLDLYALKSTKNNLILRKLFLIDFNAYKKNNQLIGIFPSNALLAKQAERVNTINSFIKNSNNLKNSDLKKKLLLKPFFLCPVADGRVLLPLGNGVEQADAPIKGIDTKPLNVRLKLDFSTIKNLEKLEFYKNLSKINPEKSNKITNLLIDSVLLNLPELNYLINSETLVSKFTRTNSLKNTIVSLFKAKTNLKKNKIFDLKSQKSQNLNDRYLNLSNTKNLYNCIFESLRDNFFEIKENLKLTSMINQINLEKNNVIHRGDSENEKKINNKNFIVKLNSNVFGGNLKLCETEKINKENSRLFLVKNLKNKSVMTFSYKFVKLNSFFILDDKLNTKKK